MGTSQVIDTKLNIRLISDKDNKKNKCIMGYQQLSDSILLLKEKKAFQYSHHSSIYTNITKHG